VKTACHIMQRFSCV